jgi:hypothetical protein
MDGTAQDGAKQNMHESARKQSKNKWDGVFKRELKSELISKVDKAVVCVYKWSPNRNSEYLLGSFFMSSL